MPSPDRAALLIRRGDTIEALFPDDERLTVALRKAIRAPLRKKLSRVEHLRTWLLDAHAYDALVAVLKADGLRVEVYSPPAAATTPRVASDYATLGLAEGAPWPLVQAAYRVMSKISHPDVSGKETTDAMKAINLAYARLERQQAARGT